MGTNLYLWTKVLHIVMVTSWFAGLFYLPRIYVNLAQVDPKGSTAEYQRLVGMSQRLYRFMLPLATLAVLTGLVKKFAAEQRSHSERWFRVFNEGPVILLLIVVAMVIIKPF